jgi:hypothetical protein
LVSGAFGPSAQAAGYPLQYPRQFYFAPQRIRQAPAAVASWIAPAEKTKKAEKAEKRAAKLKLKDVEANKDQVALTPQEALEASQRQLSKRWRAAPAQRVTPLGGKSARVLEVETGKGLFIVRRPHRGMAQGLRVNVAQQRMALEMGEARLVPPAIVETLDAPLDAETPAGTQVIIVKHAGASYTNANLTAPALLASIPEHARLVGAIIDLVSEQQDRKSENILVRKTGDVMKLIDPDKSFGQRSGRKYRSQLFQGGMLGYASKQDRFEDLPTDLQAYITKLASASIAEIQATYTLDPKEAQVASNQAQQIRALGLTPAVDAYVLSLGALHAPE